MKLENGKKLIILNKGIMYELKPANPYGFEIIKSEYNGEHWQDIDSRWFSTEYGAIWWFNNERGNPASYLHKNDTF